MNSIQPRQIRNRQATRFFPDLLQSIFAGEILAPSEELWLVSPWISDIPILNNAAGQFRSVVPEWDLAPIRISQILHYLAKRSTKIHVAIREEKHNKPFLQCLEMVDGINIYVAPLLHEKGLLGDDYFLSGSFNLTFNGITLNDEIAHLYTDKAIIAANRISFNERWRESKT